MSTDIRVRTVRHSTGRRDWLLPIASDYYGHARGASLDASLFTAGTHFPNGYVPSGTVVAKVTATGNLGPFTPGASNGLQTAVGLLFDDTTVESATDVQGGVAYVEAFAVVRPTLLPFQSGAGSLTAAARTALPTIHFEA